jgi:hypothetical protein
MSALWRIIALLAMIGVGVMAVIAASKDDWSQAAFWVLMLISNQIASRDLPVSGRTAAEESR